jgi:hypothetical protein
MFSHSLVLPDPIFGSAQALAISPFCEGSHGSRFVLEPPDQKLEFSRFSYYSCGRFSVTHTRCSVKYAWAFELLIDSILIDLVLHVTVFASIVIFHCDSSS